MGAIIAALKQGDLQNVRDLIQKGINLDVQDEQGMTALQYSVANGHLDIVKLLLMAGADPNIENGFLDEYVQADLNHQYIEKDNVAIVEHMIEEIQSLTSTSALHIAIKRNDIESLKVLLEYGADPNILDLGCCSPLHWAATKGNEAAIRLLLETNIELNLQDLARSTALHEAVRKKNIKIIELLVQNGADPNIVDICGDTAFDLVGDNQQILDVILLNCKSIPSCCVIH